MKNYSKAHYLLDDCPHGNVHFHVALRWLMKVAIFLLEEKVKECVTSK